jgi:replicative DNA helicase
MNFEDQALPQNLDAEKFILASSMNGPDVLSAVMATINPDDFSLYKHREIYGAQCELYQQGSTVDLLTVSNYFAAKNKLDVIDGISYLASLDDGNLTQILDLAPQLQIVKEKSILRRTIFAAEELKQACFLQQESGEVIDRAQRLLTSLSCEKAERGKLRSPGEIIGEYGLNEFLSPRSDNSINSPWPSWNRIVGGFQANQLVVVAARPGLGKTALALTQAVYTASQGIGVALYSLEMSDTEILRRAVCSLARVNSLALRHGKVTSEERRRLSVAAEQLSGIPLFVDDNSGCTVPSLHASLRKLRSSENIGLVVIDYLQLMDVVGRPSNRTEAISAISRGLKKMAREFAIPILALAQLNRASETERRRPVLSDLRESGSIEQDADSVSFLYNPEPKAHEPVIQTELIVAKQRNGPTGTVDLCFDRVYTTFREVAAA